MAMDTREQNQALDVMGDQEQFWLFGYGSLIYKADFPFLERCTASIHGWQRRFWQGSHDHRGTPQAPGRVVTLVPAPGCRCDGVAYRVTPAVFRQLDKREKNGYLRVPLTLSLADGSTVPGLVYHASEDNAAFLGPAPVEEIARHIAASHGPSGSNRDYLLQLASALRGLDSDDEHVFAIEQALPESL